MTTGLFRHASSVLHEMGAGHPECPERIAAIEGELEQRGYLAVLAACNAPVATGEQLARVHTAAHIDRVNRMAPAHGVVALDPDTVMNRHSLTAALHAAGAVVAATDAVIEGEMDNAFCLVRPPGHHATRETSMGFCIFNNVAVGIAHAMEQHGLQRVAVLDFDVHHGNGTEDIFRDDARVLMCSTYQYPWYPHQNNRSIPGHLVNCPLPSGTGSAGFRAAVNDHWLPALAAFRPEMIFISAGFDAHRDDPLAGLALVDEDYRWVTEQIMACTATSAGGRIVSTLEGGYALAALARSAAEHVGALASLQ